MTDMTINSGLVNLWYTHNGRSLLTPHMPHAGVYSHHMGHMQEPIHTMCATYMRLVTPYVPHAGALFTPHVPHTGAYSHHMHHMREPIHTICTTYRSWFTPHVPHTWDCSHHMCHMQEPIHTTCATCRSLFTPCVPHAGTYSHHMGHMQEPIHTMCATCRSLFTPCVPHTVLDVLHVWTHLMLTTILWSGHFHLTITRCVDQGMEKWSCPRSYKTGFEIRQSASRAYVLNHHVMLTNQQLLNKWHGSMCPDI